MKVWSKLEVRKVGRDANGQNLIKHLGYILGEYGHLIVNDQGYSPYEQFISLHSKSQFCSAPTRALLLSTYIKWVNVFPEIKTHIVGVFERYRHVLDSELQQRACEYYALATRPEEDDLLQNICEEMPPFPPRESALLNRLNRKHGDTEDKRTWIIGGKEANLDREAARHKPGSDANDVATNGLKSHHDDTDIISSLVGLDLSSSAAGSVSEQRSTVEISNSAATTAKTLTAASVLRGPNVDRWFEKLSHSNEGVLYEDAQIQMGIKSEYHAQMGRVAIYFGNKVAAPLTSFTATLSVSDPEALSVSFAKIPPNTVSPRAQTQQLLHVECKKTFTTPPILTVSFIAGSHQSLAVRLPIVITKFFEPVQLGPADFFERWKLIGGPPREAQRIFPINLDGAGHVDIGKNKKVVTGHRFGVLDEVDPNPVNLVGAGVLHTSEAGKVGCLLRVEPNREAKVSHCLYSDRMIKASMSSAVSHYRTQYLGRGGCRGLTVIARCINWGTNVITYVELQCMVQLLYNHNNNIRVYPIPFTLRSVTTNCAAILSV